MVTMESRKIYKTSPDEKSSIQCASLNKSSLQSFATGHENGAIKIWKIGENESISSFESNLAITCVALNNNNNNNNFLGSGNIGGGIKIYDLNENKLVRNYGEHRSEIKDLNFFDFNNGTTLIVSSSSDSNIKIWDIRQKTSISTFKGHGNAVNCIDFSPDGSWIVSGDSIGHTKLWDISTSKCLHEFHDKQAINDVLFHPEELVLATAVGKVVRFWDLETMKHISRTSKVTTPIQKILFPQNTDDNQENQFVFSASNQSLRIWQWQPLPVYCVNNVSVHWNNTIGDMQHMKGYNDLICLELDKNRNKVIVWLTDIGQIFENNNDQQKKIEQYYTPSISVSTIQEKDEDVYDDDEFEEIDEEDIPTDNIQKKENINNESTQNMQTNKTDMQSNGSTQNTQTIETKTETLGENININMPNCLKNMPQEMWTKSFFEAADIVRKKRAKRKNIIPLLPKTKEKDKENEKKNDAFITNKQLKRSPTKNEGNDTNDNLTNKENAILIDKNLKFAQFIPKHLVDFDERELIKIKRSMMTDHIPILRMLSTRLRYLRQLKSLWKKKKTNEFMEIITQIQNDNDCKGNNALFISFVGSILKDISNKTFSFRFCYLLLSVIDLKQLDIKNENVIITILNYIKFLLETFSSLIIDTLKIEIVNDKDINMTGRRQYCQNCYDLLTKDIKSFICKTQKNIKQNAQEPNIKIDELCTNILTLIDLLN